MSPSNTSTSEPVFAGAAVLAELVAMEVITVAVNEPDVGRVSVVEMVGVGFVTGIGVTATLDRLRREEEVGGPITLMISRITPTKIRITKPHLSKRLFLIGIWLINKKDSRRQRTMNAAQILDPSAATKSRQCRSQRVGRSSPATPSSASQTSHRGRNSPGTYRR